MEELHTTRIYADDPYTLAVLFADQIIPQITTQELIRLAPSRKEAPAQVILVWFSSFAFGE